MQRDLWVSALFSRISLFVRYCFAKWSWTTEVSYHTSKGGAYHFENRLAVGPALMTQIKIIFQLFHSCETIWLTSCFQLRFWFTETNQTARSVLFSNFRFSFFTASLCSFLCIKSIQLLLNSPTFQRSCSFLVYMIWDLCWGILNVLNKTQTCSSYHNN